MLPMVRRTCRALPPASSLWELFAYDPLRGLLINRLPRGSRSKIGAVAGCIDKCGGYTSVDLRGKRYLAHRLIYKWVTGADPEGHIDHVGQEGLKPKYNAFHVLQVVSQRENTTRGHAHHKQSTLPIGVTRSGKYYSVSIAINGERVRIGQFEKAEDAGAAYQSALQCVTENLGWRPSLEFVRAHNGRIKTSTYKGVSFHANTGKWRAQLMNPATKKIEHLGLFSTEEAAASAVTKKRGSR